MTDHVVQVDAELAAVRLSNLHDRIVTAAAIRRWASRGHVTRSGWRGRTALYSLAALEKYAEELYASDLTTL